ncbi:leucine-rich repeat-containing protein 72 isoform X4 [Neopelma chrysocephalum]|uniref:leucine-rich repeat-containing protein 72 isoform X4 n=1 Tax=Neopelma chrysocephalum TaxID=114329 RepID=UPI000FCCF2B4|nr:leucine-rich repeat-containing protein 72 isoform X4 [Neopelma chrysocephalum]
MRSHVTQYAKYKSLGTAFLTCRTRNPRSLLSGAVENQLKICGFKSNGDVIGLYLARQGLRSIPSLSQFNRLKYLWLNNNKIQDLNFLIKNYCLTELYLNNNELTDISGALKHLCSLQILFLHNNELKNLGKTVKELKGMISLHTLNLFQNPLAYDPDYRLYVIYILPSVQLLDRKLVTQRERESAFHLYNPERSLLVQSIAFGKRVKTPLGTPVGSRRCIHPPRRLIMPSGCEFGDNTNKVPFENPEDAVLVRAMTRSLTEFSSVDWNKVATCQERRLQNKAEEPLEKLTVQFR